MKNLEIKFNLDTALASLPHSRLEEMAAAGATVIQCVHRLDKAGANVVGRCLENQGTFYEFDHYPDGDVYDDEFHAQYYYHSHRPEAGEHGHFHTFLRKKGMPKSIHPAPYKGKAKRPMGKDALAHFVAIAMDKPGSPLSLFTTNRWVTDETYYTADDTIAMLDLFKLDHTYPCLAVNLWITSMLQLFRPQIEALLIKRDETLKNWQASHPGVDVFEDRDLELTSVTAISVDDQVAGIERALAGALQSA